MKKTTTDYGIPLSNAFMGMFFFLCLNLILFYLILSYVNVNYQLLLFFISLIICIIFEAFFINLIKKRYKKKVEYISNNMTDLANLKGNELILDLGTGSGPVAISFAKKLKNGKAIGLDSYALEGKNIFTQIINLIKINHFGSNLTKAKKNLIIEKLNDKCKFYTGDLSNPLKIREKSIDIITSRQCLYCISYDKQLNLFKEIDRILKTDGLLIFQEPQKFFGWDIKNLKEYFEGKGYIINCINLPKKISSIWLITKNLNFEKPKEINNENCGTINTSIFKILIRFSNVFFSEIYFGKIHNHLPKFLRKIVSQMIIFFRDMALMRINDFYISMCLLSGKDKINKEDLRLLFFGDDLSFHFLSNNFVKEKFFYGEPEKIDLGRVFIGDINRRISDFSLEVDAVITKTDRFFADYLQKKGFCIIPECVDMQLDISESIEKIFEKFNKSAKKDCSRVKKFGYCYDIKTDSEKLDFFLNKIYFPYRLYRHDEEILPGSYSYNEIRSIFEDGKLIFIKDKDEYIAGSLINTNHVKKTIFMMGMGILPDPELIIKNVGSALVYYSIIWAKENGFSKMEWGATPPFFNNGIFKFKKKWGSKIKKSIYIPRIYGIKLISKKKQLLDFVTDNPIVYLEDNKFKGLVFLKDTITCEQVEQILKHYFITGMTQLSIVFISKLDENVISFAYKNYGRKIVFLDYSKIVLNQ